MHEPPAWRRDWGRATHFPFLQVTGNGTRTDLSWSSHRFKNFCLFNPCFIVAAIVVSLMAATYRLDRPQLPLQENRVVDVEAWICTAPETLDNYLYAELCTRSLVQEGQLISYPGRIALYVNLPRSSIEKDPVPPLHYGEVIRFRGCLEEPTYHAIPGVPDFRQVLWSQGILHVVHLKSALQIQHPGDASVSLPWRHCSVTLRASQLLPTII